MRMGRGKIQIVGLFSNKIPLLLLLLVLLFSLPVKPHPLSWREETRVHPHVGNSFKNNNKNLNNQALLYPPSPQQQWYQLSTSSLATKRYPFHLDFLYATRKEPQFWIKSGECPRTPDGTQEYFCPTPDEYGFWSCIDDYQLCDGVRNCPQAEDENPSLCLFYNAVESQLNIIAKSVTENT